MIDPRISMGVTSPKASQAINIFENALMNSQTRNLRQAQEQRAAEMQPFQLQQAQQGVDANTQKLELGELQNNQERRDQFLQSINDFAVSNASVIQQAEQTGDPTQLRNALG